MNELQDDFITLKIPTARQKLLPGFPNDTVRGDFKIIFKSKVFNLCKAHLRLQSGYFQKVCATNENIHEIKQDFKQQAFEKILSCFYGATVKMQRAKFGQYYPIIKFLDIQSLLSFLRKDVLKNIAEYDLFDVMRIGHKYSDQQIFVKCLQQLQSQSFEQLKLHQFSLLQCDESLFRLIIKAHDRHRNEGKAGIPYKEIDGIIRDYCDGRGKGQDGYRALKLQLINQNSLTSSQYKQIFLDEYIKIKNSPQSAYMNEYPTGLSIIVNNNPNQVGGKLDTNRLAQSIIGVGANMPKSSMIMTGASNNPAFGYSGVNQMTLQMQNTFQRKQNEQLKMRNLQLQQQLKVLKQLTDHNQKCQKQNQQQLRILKNDFQKKIQQENEYKNKIKYLQQGIHKMNIQLDEQNKKIRYLEQQIQLLKSRKGYGQSEQDEYNHIVQSQFLPSHLISQMMGGSMPKLNKTHPPEKKEQVPNYKQMDQQKLEQLYMPRISFDIEPISTPKYNLPKLCIFITTQGFSKHSLTLIYRRSINQPQKGNNEDIRQKGNLLFLINTTTGKNIGGFVSVKIPRKVTNDYIEDEGAFIFSLTENQKFCVKKGNAKEAIFLSDEYLISFSSDLIIPNNCLSKKGECSWPSSYESAKQVKTRGASWFAGDKQFSIKDLEVYQMGQEQMQMNIY